MPTGYTEALYDGDQEFETFAMRAARAFGALVEMRDMGMDAEIPESFAPSSYHPDQLAKARARLADIRALTDDGCRQKAEADYERWDADRKASAATTAARRARYEVMRSRVLSWHPPTDDHTPLRDFMVEQLDESIRFDCSEWESAAPTRDGAEWRTEQIATATRDIEYHEREAEKDRQRARERTEWVRALRESLHGIPVAG